MHVTYNLAMYPNMIIMNIFNLILTFLLLLDMPCLILLFLTLAYAESGNLGKGPVRQSIHQSICESILAHPSMMTRWIFFILGTMNRYIPWATGACKIELGSVPNLSN